MSSIFSNIISRKIPAYIIAEDEHNIAFLDINPNALGHTLCVPKTEVDKIFDLKDKDYQHLMLFSKQVATALEKAIDCKRVGIAVIGLEVPHAHVHLIPLHEMKEMDFQHKIVCSPEEFNQLALQIKSYL